MSVRITHLMVKPFGLTYLVKGGGGGGERDGVVVTPSLNLNHCLPDLLLIFDLQTNPRSTRVQIKSCQYFLNAHDKVLKLRCYELFDRFQRYVEIVRKVTKSAITLSLGNIMT